MTSNGSRRVHKQPQFCSMSITVTRTNRDRCLACGVTTMAGRRAAPGCAVPRRVQAAGLVDPFIAVQAVPMTASGTSRRKISAVLGPTPLKRCSRWLISSRVLAVRTSRATEPS